MTEPVRDVTCRSQLGQRQHQNKKAHSGQQIAASIIIKTLASVCLIGILARLGVRSTRASLPNDGQQLPSGERDFQLYSRVMVIAKESVDIGIRLATFEQYSGSLRRGRVDLKPHQASQMAGTRTGLFFDNRKLASYFYGENFGANKLIKVTNEPEPCQQVARSELASELFGKETVLEMSELNDLLNDGLPGSMVVGDSAGSGQHVFGVARFLAYFERNRANFKYTSRPLQISLRNTEIDLFEYKYLAPSNGTRSISDNQVLIKVFLPASSALDRSDSSGRLPMRAWLLFPSKLEVVIDFHAIKPIQLSRASIQAGSSWWWPMSEQFNLPAGLGCSRLIQKPADQANRLVVLETDRSNEICSFEFELSKMTPMGREPFLLQRSFVAYDGIAGALRVEPISKISAASARPSEITIYDLHSGFKFHLEARNSRRQFGDNGNQWMLGAKTSTTQSCRIARLAATELLPMEPILPTEQMAEIGLGQVRGIPTLIYETTGSQLPWMIFEKVTWVDANKRQQTKFDPTDKGASDYYTLVYYVTRPTTTIGTTGTTHDSAASREQSRLVRLDVYHDSTPLYRVELFNFDWRLGVAPNGDSHAQLFSVRDHCLQPDSSQQELDLVLALVDDESKDESESKSVSTKITTTTTSDQEARRLVELLQRSPTKHIDLIRGLSLATSSISATRVLDMQFRVSLERGTTGSEKEEEEDNYGSKLANGYSVKLLASVRLMSAGQSAPLFRAYTVATGLQLSNTRPIENVFTFNDCFWLASKWAQPKWVASDPSSRNPQPGTVFTFCSSRCWIDTKAGLRRWHANRSTLLELPQLDSRAFLVVQLVRQGLPCELLLVEEIGSNRQASQFEPIIGDEEILGELENKLLEMNHLAAGSTRPLDTLNNTSLTFKVERARMKQDAMGAAAVSLSVNGLTFGAFASATHSAWQMNPPGSSNDNQELKEFTNSRLSKQSLTPETCHALCVINPVCKSYSICLRSNQQVECLGSSVDLRDQKFHTKLGSKLDEYQDRRQTSGKIVMRDERDGSLEFIVDKRCKLRAKRAAEMFREVDKRIAQGRGRLYLNSLSPVTSRERCAERCLETNVKYFSRLRRAQKVIRGQGPREEGEEEGEEGDTDEQRVTNRTDELHDQHLDTMRFWCDRYKYLDLKPGPGILKQVQQSEQFRRADMDKIEGVCYLARGQWAGKSGLKGDNTRGSRPGQQAKIPLIALAMNTFEFRYDLLYARQEGIRLLGAKKTEDGQDLKRVPETGELNPSGMTRDDPVGSNESGLYPLVVNFQTIVEHPADVGFCARQCFTQAVQWCRSFDLIQTNTTSHCVYNSLTRDEALRASAAAGRQETNGQTPTDKSSEERPPVGSNVHYYHFEPNDAYTLDIIILKMASAVREQQQHEELLCPPPPPSPANTSSSSSIWICLFGLVSGVAFAALIINRWRNDSFEHHPQLHPRVSLAKLSFSLPTECAPESSLMSQDQLEIRHNAQEQLHLEQMTNKA